MSLTKVCERCTSEKPVGHFRKVPTRFGGDGWSKKCKACQEQLRDLRREDEGAPEGSPAAPDNDHPKLSIPMCMPVDCEFDGTDFVMTQVNDGTTHTVFVAPQTLRKIWDFAEGLAKQEQAAEPAS